MAINGINEGWKQLISKYTLIKEAVAAKIAPYWTPIAARLNPYWQPVREKYAQWTEPIRVWHRKLKESRPMLANGIQWSYDIARYGFYFSLVWYFCLDRALWTHAG
ncbi:MAG: hypothetical protein IPK46_00930 [Saprospiraceae bacterium]|nr:hypothetical protein [Saprospiraceae bacterium]